MKIKAGAGYCLIDNSKIRIKQKGSEIYCMYKGRRYLFKKHPPKDKIITVEVTRGRIKKKSSYRTKPRNSRRKRKSKRRPRSVFMKRRSMIKGRSFGRKKISKRRLTKLECKKKLSLKIAKNIKEFKNGKFKSRSQAIAVSYSQVKKKYPECKRYFKIK